MSGPNGAAGSRVLLVDAGKPVDIFDTVDIDGGVARVRTAFLFELGEELALRIEEEGVTFEVQARVRAHVGTGLDKVTELELGDRTPVASADS